MTDNAASGWDQADDQEYVFQIPWHIRLRIWVLDDLARLRFWK